MKSPKNLLHKGSLITYRDGSKEVCLGYLIVHEGRAYEPTFGVVDVTAEEAETHNRLLSQAEIDGLDRNCKIGMKGVLYWSNGRVETYMGARVSDGATKSGNTVVFTRNGKAFRGTLNHQILSFTRIQ